jgi:hypothetical protein
MLVIDSDGRVPVRVVVESELPTGCEAVLSIQDGLCTLRASAAMVSLGRSDLRGHLLRYIDACLNPLPANTYVRVTISRDDHSHLAAGTHRGSINHATGDAEGGLSVALYPEYPAPYGYYVTGEVVGRGTDGEPLLNPSTARPVSRLMTWKQLTASYEIKQRQRLNTVDLTEAERRLLVGESYLVWPSVE